MIASSLPSPFNMDVAVALAAEASDATGQQSVDIEETLGLALFHSGDVGGAVHTHQGAVRLCQQQDLDCSRLESDLAWFERALSAG